MGFIRPFLDPNQCEESKGVSINHYLLKLLNFVFSILDRKQPHSVLSVLVDMEKAFKKVDHNLIIEDLYAMKCPSWLLKIIFSYLSKKTSIVKYKDSIAEPQPLNAGSPEGTVLEVLIFIVKFNGACQRPKIERNK